jgi:redox-sensitive bicupin YhaK (pirin superfamily)
MPHPIVSAAPRRRVTRTVTTPAPSPGFIGAGHTAVLVVDPARFEEHDPFIVLADDRIAIPEGSPAGGEHPHAGFETVTFVLEGTLRDRDEGVLQTGDLQWMTAGRGVIHNEDVIPLGPTRILQLWLTLPEAERWVAPRFETVRRDAAPVRREAGVEVRVYSGRSGDARATTHNYVPVTILDVRLEPGAAFEQELPASYRGFVYVLEGEARVGDDAAPLRTAQVGWVEPAGDASDASVLRLAAGASGARLVLYAGEPQNAPIALHGPFVGGTRADLVRASTAYRNGEFARMSELVRAAR